MVNGPTMKMIFLLIYKYNNLNQLQKSHACCFVTDILKLLVLNDNNCQ